LLDRERAPAARTWRGGKLTKESGMIGTGIPRPARSGDDLYSWRAAVAVVKRLFLYFRAAPFRMERPEARAGT